jgi:hypothetical protein
MLKKTARKKLNNTARKKLPNIRTSSKTISKNLLVKAAYILPKLKKNSKATKIRK